jgi:hypothetical protein
MKKYLYQFALLICLSVIFFTSCAKDDAKENPYENSCLQMSKFEIKPVSPVLLGQEIKIFCDTVNQAEYLWSGPAGFSSYAQNPVISNSANLYMEGWYSVRITHDSCTTVEDSVYVDIRLPQGVPDCTLTDGEVSFDNMQKISPAGIRSIGESIGGFQIYAGGFYSDIYMNFSDFWIDRELEDGIYYTSNDPFPDDLDRINFRVVTNSFSFYAKANLPVYISHVNGKVRVSFCNIPISDSNGVGLSSIMTGQLTED